MGFGRIIWILLAVASPAMAAPEASPVAVRAQMLTVTPATGPIMHVLVKNLTGAEFTGQLAVEFPAGWKVNKDRQPLKIAAGQVARVAFAIEKAANSAENSYPLKMEVTADAGGAWTFAQSIVCASAPYLDVKLDAKLDAWHDTIPVTFGAAGNKTVIRTAYTRRNFFILVGVEQETHRAMDESGKQPFDAVQVAIAPADAATPAAAGEKSQRFEFLLAGTALAAKCFVLSRPGDALSDRPVELAGRELLNTKLTVFRADGMTWYQWAAPFKILPGIEPEPGREFCLSVLAHDAEGLRDWGQAAGLWPSQRGRFGWVRWAGSNWPAEGAFDSAVEWGFCSSAQ